VKGTDYQGDLEIFRRYREFFNLREILASRYPGLYIPPLPEKKGIVTLNNVSLKNIE